MRRVFWLLDAQTRVMAHRAKRPADAPEHQREVDELLSAAAASGNTDDIVRLRAAGADPNAHVGTSVPTALQRSVRGGHVAATTSLLNAGAHVDGASSDGWTPLMYAARRGNCVMIALLLKHGANLHLCNVDGDTALHMASMHGGASAAEMLLAHGARPGERNKRSQRPVDVVSGIGMEAPRMLMVAHTAYSDTAS